MIIFLLIGLQCHVGRRFNNKNHDIEKYYAVNVKNVVLSVTEPHIGDKKTMACKIFQRCNNEPSLLEV